MDAPQPEPVNTCARPCTWIRSANPVRSRRLTGAVEQVQRERSCYCPGQCSVFRPLADSNELQYKWVAEETWLFERIFEIDADTLAYKHREWLFMGLDVEAGIIFNNNTIFRRQNAFRCCHVLALANQSYLVLQAFALSPATLQSAAMPRQMATTSLRCAPLAGSMYTLQISTRVCFLAKTILQSISGQHQSWPQEPQMVPMTSQPCR